MNCIPLDKANQLLLGKQHLTPQLRGLNLVTVTRDIAGLHATYPLGPYLSLWARLKGFSPDLLEAALYADKSLLRFTCMRSTLHIVPSDMASIYFQATKRGQRRTEKHLGLMLVEAGLCDKRSEARTLQRLQDRVVRALAQSGPLTVKDLKQHVPELGAQLQYAADKSYTGTYGFGSQLVSWMCTEGILMRGRPRGTRHSNLYEYDRLAAWSPGLALDGQTPENAQVQLVRVYLDAFGPATLDDIAWWSGLGKRAVARALAAMGESAMQLGLEGMDHVYWMLVDDAALLDSVTDTNPAVSLLPRLDPFVMAYRDRQRFLDPERRHQVFDRAGNAFATVWVGARIVGVWREVEGGLQLLLWDHQQLPAVADEAARLTRFLPELSPANSDARQSLDIDIAPYPSTMYVATPFRLAMR